MNQDDNADLAALIEDVADLLPAQGPIRSFIHHNPLHGLEHLPFEEAVVAAAGALGREPFLSERQGRQALARERIGPEDVDAVLAEQLGSRADESVVDGVTRLELARRLTVHGFPEARGPTLSWLLTEEGALERLRRDVPDDARASIARHGTSGVDGHREAEAARELWAACLDAVGRLDPAPPAPPPPSRRHRDLLIAACGIDTDAWVHPLLVRFVGAYLDQGLASWALPGRDDGIHACFLATYATPVASLCGPWAALLRELVARDRDLGASALESVEASLRALGVPTEDRRDYLADTLLALPGWAGMIRQLELVPARAPARPVAARLVDFVAIRLLLERACALHAARAHLSDHGELSTLRERLLRDLRGVPAVTDEERAWPLFHAAQLLGFGAARMSALSRAAITALEAALGEHDGLDRRRTLHLAYERRLRHRFLDAMCSSRPAPATARAPAFQAIFCIDEREESIRRHLEEADPEVETFGAAGFFGIAMYYRGVTDARPRALCPAGVIPTHEVIESVDTPPTWWRRVGVRGAGRIGMGVHTGSRTLVRGTILMAAFGVVSLIPLVFRVVFPWLGERLVRIPSQVGPRRRTSLPLDRESGAASSGRRVGFTVAEMADIVARQLEDIGLRNRLAELVLVVAHGSSSLNNPHEAAHDCGACGGGRGGPNARAFAQMANDPRVRAVLADRGAPIPDATWFVGAQRNTASNAIALFDVDRVPARLAFALERARAALERARTNEAHERCRRFDVPTWIPPAAALVHVEARAVDLAQTRPEYGHATNACCVVGRRERTADLFLDRRAFLVTYDPTLDDDGRVLARLLAAAVPVMAGINLEYYFGYVDPTGYGCGTKLPHNVTGLLGVMDGAQSDLRTGLPWQMVEIHEPVRLSIVVECGATLLQRVIAADAHLSRLVRNRWVYIASLDPDSDRVVEIDARGARPYAPERPVPHVPGGSVLAYRGQRGHLPFTRLRGRRA